MPTSSFVDFTDAICPGTTCPLVIGHVVVHRAGDHLTATYAATLGDRVIAEAVKDWFDVDWHVEIVDRWAAAGVQWARTVPNPSTCKADPS